jgi:prepilin-type processing-associated H-X9-DG protein
MKPREKLAAVIIIAFIVVLLIAAFLPTLGTADQTRCTANLKALSIALSTYAGDHDMLLPAAADWAETLGPHYLEDLTIATCPAARPSAEQLQAYAGHKLRLPVGYALLRPLGGVNSGRVYESEKIPMLFDSDLFQPNASGDPSAIVFRHADKKANVCFADGHVEPVTAAPAVPAKLLTSDAEVEQNLRETAGGGE